MIRESDIREPFLSAWKEADPFDRVRALDGEVFRAVKNRRTLRFEQEGRGYFIKIHGVSSWREILKNFFQFKMPVLGADNEYHAIRKLEELGIPTMTVRAYARRGRFPDRLESFLITDEILDHTSLEDFCRDWAADPPSSPVRHAVIEKLAETCSVMHRAGVNHRDCYLCHFLLDRKMFREEGKVSLLVLDLHRAAIRNRVPRRLLVKDLAGILFSSMDAGLSVRDILRFRAVYEKNMPLSPALRRAVFRTAVRLYRKEFGRNSPAVTE